MYFRLTFIVIIIITKNTITTVNVIQLVTFIFQVNAFQPVVVSISLSYIFIIIMLALGAVEKKCYPVILQLKDLEPEVALIFIINNMITALSSSKKKKRTVTYHQQQDSVTLSSSTATGQLSYHHQQQDSYHIINNRTFTLSSTGQFPIP